MVDKSKLTKASRISPSLRTTVPMYISKYFNLRAGDELEWHLFSSEDEKENAILIIPVTAGMTNIEKFTFKRVKGKPGPPVEISPKDEEITISAEEIKELKALIAERKQKEEEKKEEKKD
jgi:bifunctional DNA-binding transcriptional regulator/antitoxin component of YhaV-PrlF toxin-antitoxin module